MNIRAVIAVVIAVLLAAPAGAASVYLEQTETAPEIMGQGGGTKQQKIWISDGNFRAEEVGSGRYLILRDGDDVAHFVDENAHKVIKVPLSQISALAAAGAQMLQAMGGGNGKPDTLSAERTGETKQFGAWTAYEVRVRGAGAMNLDIRMWLTEDLGIGMGDWIHVAEAMQMKGLFGDAIEDLRAFTGYPVLTETRMNVMGMKVEGKTELTLARTGPVDPALFVPPKDGYTWSEGLESLMPGGIPTPTPVPGRGG